MTLYRDTTGFDATAIYDDCDTVSGLKLPHYQRPTRPRAVQRRRTELVWVPYDPHAPRRKLHRKDERDPIASRERPGYLPKRKASKKTARSERPRCGTCMDRATINKSASFDISNYGFVSQAWSDLNLFSGSEERVLPSVNDSSFSFAPQHFYETSYDSNTVIAPALPAVAPSPPGTVRSPISASYIAPSPLDLSPTLQTPFVSPTFSASSLFAGASLPTSQSYNNEPSPTQSSVLPPCFWDELAADILAATQSVAAARLDDRVAYSYDAIVNLASETLLPYYPLNNVDENTSSEALQSFSRDERSADDVLFDRMFESFITLPPERSASSPP
ncbi:hypothetical protein FISHEDRAFT_69951 [Fistulina hepatica ATCC 64428]|uniref:Uncharacterized protein n=1 Tax=Fistulina hepatica ATCC 64428 TaxID=1128425 RepID=A0A0D7ANB2_9AGAR|nr:hypothetical protein FISHEDRAFT_69951 [Fistulina hepatica ATCC 64428]